ncbi:MAG: hypothetical protein QGH73_08845 [Rhodospirillales bacterium]|nr:hypothetical protein [Rhodospirillales bacterium]
MDRIPSFGGPPDIISLKSTDFFLKSVFGHSNFQRSGLAEALPIANDIKMADIKPANATCVIGCLNF